MNITENIRRISTISMFQAPSSAKVTPVEIPPKCENIEIITGGKVLFEINGELKTFERGTIFWHLPGETTVWNTPKDAPYQCISIRVSTYDHPKRQVPRVSSWDSPEDLNKFTQEALESFHDDSIDQDVLFPYVYARVFWQAYYYTRRKPDPGYPPFLRKLLYLINKNPGRDLSMEILAETAGVSIPHIHTQFKKYIKMSPHRYILGRRLQKARNMLAGGSLSIKEISAECGFSNLESFYRAFKKYFDITPGDYRIKHTPYLNH